MSGATVLLETMLALKTKAEVYREAFPVGSVVDPESPAYIDMLQSLKAAAVTVKKLEADQIVLAKELVVTLTKQQQEAESQAAKLAAQEAAEQQARAAMVKAALAQVGKSGLQTLPFEEAHSPKAARLQQMITRFSQIGNATMIKHHSGKA